MNKEERTSRIPVPKRDSTVIPRAPRNAATIRASDAKSNQVAQRGNQVAQRGNRCKIAQWFCFPLAITLSYLKRYYYI